MHTTKELLDDLRKRYGVSDYKAADMLEISKQTVSNYRTERGGCDQPVALKFAYFLDLPEQYVLACVSAERAKRSDVRRAWERIAKAATATAATVLLAFTGTQSAEAAPLADQAYNASNIYYGKSHMERLRTAIRCGLRRLRALHRSNEYLVLPA